MQTTKHRGTIAEAIVIAELMKQGWKVLLPFGEDSAFDLVAHDGSNFVRVQVKYATVKNGVIGVKCRSTNGFREYRYTSENVDVIAVYEPKKESVYFVPSSEFSEVATLLHLRVDEPKVASPNIRWARDYTNMPG